VPSSEFVDGQHKIVSGSGKEADDAEKERIRGAATAVMGKFANSRLGSTLDWEAKRVEVFESMSGHMRASWARPIPGSPILSVQGYDTAKQWPQALPKLSEVGQGDDEKWKLVQGALTNFALVIIDPLEVDHVELGVVPNRRTRYEWVGDNWVEQIVVP